MQTLHAGHSKLEPKIIAPPQTPVTEARDGQNLISWRWSLPLPTDSVWWGSMHAISSYRGNRPTNKQTHTHPQTGSVTIHCTTASLARSVNMNILLLIQLWTAAELRTLQLNNLQLNTLYYTTDKAFNNSDINTTHQNTIFHSIPVITV